MAVSIGELLLELKLDINSYQSGLDEARSMAAIAGRDIENLISGRKLPTLKINVDDRALYALNKHLDVKDRHIADINRRAVVRVRTDSSGLDVLEQRLRNIKTSIGEINKNSLNVRTSAVIQSPTVQNSSGQRNDYSQLADLIGKSVAKHTKPNAVSKVSGFIGNTAMRAVSVPLSIAGKSVSAIANSVVLSITEQVTKNLGKGLSTAIETSISANFGSTELIGEKVGGALGSGIKKTFVENVDQLPNEAEKLVENIAKKLKIPPNLVKSFGREVKEGLKEDIDSAKKLVTELKSVAAETIGEDAITKESLSMRAKQRSKTTAKVEPAREQAAMELRKAARSRDEIQRQIDATSNRAYTNLPMLAQQRTKSRNELQELSREIEQLKSKAAIDPKASAKLRSLVSQFNLANAELNQVNAEIRFLTEFHPKRLQKRMDARDQTQGKLTELQGEYDKAIQSGNPETASELIADISLLEVKFKKLSKTLELVNGPIDRANKKMEAAQKNFESLKPQELPKAYRTMLKAVFGRELTAEEAPQLIVDKTLADRGANAEYSTLKNQIYLRPELAKSVMDDSMSENQSISLGHEIRHGQQFDLGSYKGILAHRRNEPLVEMLGNEEDLKKYALDLSQYAPEKRAYELDARVVGELVGKRYSNAKAQERGQQLKIDAAQNIEKIASELKKVKDKLAIVSRMAAENADVVDESAMNNFAENNVKFIYEVRDQLKALQNTILSAEIPDQATYEAKLKEFENALIVYFGAVKKRQGIIDGYIGKQADEISSKREEQRLRRLEADKRQIRDLLPQFSKKELIQVSQGFGLSTNKLNKKQLSEQLIDKVPMENLQPAVFAITRKKAQQQILREERMQDIAEGSGKVIRNISEGLGAVVNSPATKALGNGIKGSALALGTVAKASYSLAQGMESLALDLLPMGRTIKGVAQQTVLPAATFMAATHFLPGGHVAGEALTNLTQGAIQPFMHGASGTATGAATEFISGALPNVFGIQGAVTSAVTGVIEGATTALTSGIAQAGAAVLGGKVIQTVATAPLKQLPGIKEPGQIPLALPSADKELVLAQPPKLTKAEKKQMRLAAENESRKMAQDVAYKAGEIAGDLNDFVQNTKKTVEKVSEAVQKLNPKDALAKAEAASKFFNAQYAQLKEAVNTGDVRKAQDILGRIKDSSAIAQKDIKLLSGSFDIKENNPENIVQKLNNRRSQISKAEKQAENLVRKMKPRDIPTDAIDIDSYTAQEFPSLKSTLEMLADIEPQETLKDTAIKALTSPRAKDLAVNAGGFVGSQVLGSQGIVPELAGDIGGALVTRNAINAGEAATKAYKKLENDEIFKTATSLQKLRMVIEQTAKEFQSIHAQEQLGKDIYGDMAGFTVGNIARLLPSMLTGIPGMEQMAAIPGKGAIAAMGTVPHLQNLREGIKKRLAKDSEEQLVAESLMPGAKNNKLSADQRRLLESVDEMINAAIKAFDNAEAEINSRAAELQQQAAMENKFAELDTEYAMQQLKGTNDFLPSEIPAELEKQSEADTKTERLGVIEDVKQRAKKALKDIQGNIPGDSFLDGVVSGFGRLKGVLVPLGAAFVGFQLLGGQIQPLIDFGKQSLDAALNIERLGRSFNFAYGSASKGKEKFEETRRSADSLGVNARSALEGQASLIGASKDTTLEGYSAELGGRALRQAALVTGSTKEQQDRAYLAISQIASKGKLSAEELRGQLGEALSGLPVQQIAARAMGMSVAGLNKQMELGNITSEQFLPRFFNQLLAETSSGVPEAMNSSQAKENRFQNRLDSLQENVGQALLPGRNLGMDVLGGAIDVLIKSIPVLAQLMTALSLTIGAELVKSLAAYVSQIGMAAIGQNALAASGNGVKLALIGINKVLQSSAFSFQGLLIGVFAGIEIFKGISSAFNDAGEKARGFSEQTQRSMDEYRKALAEAREEKLPSLDQGVGDTKKSFLGQTFLGGVIGENNSASAERSLQGNNNLWALSPVGIIAKLMGKTKENGSFYTEGEVQAQEQRIADADFITKGGENQSEILSLLEQYKGLSGVQGSGGKGVLAELKTINDQLDTVQAKRRTLLPGDAQGKRALDLQEQGLLEQQGKLQPYVSGLQSTLAANIESYKALIEDAKQRGDVQGANALNVALERSIKLQDEFNQALANVDVDAFARLSMVFGDIQSRIEKTNRELEKSANLGRRNVAQMIMGGSGSGVTDFARASNEEIVSRARITSNEKAMQEIVNNLQSTEITKTLKTVGIDDISKVSPTDIKNKIEANPNLSVGEKDRLTMAAEQYQKSIDLGVENDNLLTTNEESKAQLAQKLRDLANSINDFYVSAERSAADLALQVQTDAIQSKATSAKATLKAAFVNTQESLTGDFVSALLEFLDLLNQPLLDAISAQQQILSAQNTYQDQIKQAYQLSQQLPSQEQVSGIFNGEGQPVEMIPGSTTGIPGDSGTTTNAEAGSEATAQGGIVKPRNQTPEQFLDNLQRIQTASPSDSLKTSQSSLQSSVSLAGQNYNSQVGLIRSQLAQQNQLNSVAQEASLSNARFALEKANREIQDTGRGYSRSVIDAQSRTVRQNSIGDLGGNLRSVFRDSEDQQRSMGNFRRSLLQTVSQQEFLKERILSGALPDAFKRFLPQINETLANAERELSQLENNMADYAATRDAIVEQVKADFVNTQRSKAVENIAQASSLAIADGSNRDTSGVQYLEKVKQQNLTFDAEVKSLESLRNEGILTDDEFSSMAQTLMLLNKQSLSNLRGELQKTKYEAALSSKGLELESLKRINEARSTANSLRGNRDGVRSFDAANKGIDIGSQLANQLRNLQELRKDGKLTEDQFSALTKEARRFANLSLSNVREEMRKTAYEGTFSALSGSKGDVDFSEAEKKIRRNISVARQAGKIDDRAMAQINNAIQTLRQSNSGSISADASLVEDISSGENPFLAQAAEAFGRGDLVSLANLPGKEALGNANNALMSGFNTGSEAQSVEANTARLVEEAIRQSSQFDTLIGLVSQGLNIAPVSAGNIGDSLSNISTSSPGFDAAQRSMLMSQSKPTTANNGNNVGNLTLNLSTVSPVSDAGRVLSDYTRLQNAGAKL